MNKNVFKKCLSRWVILFPGHFFSLFSFLLNSLGGPSEGVNEVPLLMLRVCMQSSVCVCVYVCLCLYLRSCLYSVYVYVYVLKIRLEYVLLVDKRQENCSARV